MREGERVVLPLLGGKGRPGPMVRAPRLPMTSYLIDSNVWLALTWEQHPLHISASRWYASMDESPLLFCRCTMLGFLRLLANRQVMGDDGALQLNDWWRQDLRVRGSRNGR